MTPPEEEEDCCTPTSPSASLPHMITLHSSDQGHLSLGLTHDYLQLGLGTEQTLQKGSLCPSLHPKWHTIPYRPWSKVVQCIRDRGHLEQPLGQEKFYRNRREEINIGLWSSTAQTAKNTFLFQWMNRSCIVSQSHASYSMNPLLTLNPVQQATVWILC